MDWSAYLYLVVTGGLFVVFALLFYRTYKKSNRERMEEAKHRMLEDED